MIENIDKIMLEKVTKQIIIEHQLEQRKQEIKILNQRLKLAKIEFGQMRYPTFGDLKIFNVTKKAVILADDTNKHKSFSRSTGIEKFGSTKIDIDLALEIWEKHLNGEASYNCKGHEPVLLDIESVMNFHKLDNLVLTRIDDNHYSIGHGIETYNGIAELLQGLNNDD